MYKRQILSKALEWAAAHYDGWELYRHLKDHLGMEDQEISRAGFELDEFYEDEAPEDEADYAVSYTHLDVYKRQAETDFQALI